MITLNRNKLFQFQNKKVLYTATKLHLLSEASTGLKSIFSFFFSIKWRNPHTIWYKVLGGYHSFDGFATLICQPIINAYSIHLEWRNFQRLNYVQIIFFKNTTWFQSCYFQKWSFFTHSKNTGRPLLFVSRRLWNCINDTLFLSTTFFGSRKCYSAISESNLLARYSQYNKKVTMWKANTIEIQCYQ